MSPPKRRGLAILYDRLASSVDPFGRQRGMTKEVSAHFQIGDFSTSPEIVV